jgi:hypothetical protein
VLLYRSGCPKCRDVIANYGKDQLRLSHEGKSVCFAVIEVPPYGSGALPSSPQVAYGRLSDGRRWSVSVPLLVRLEDGICTEVGPAR